MEDYKVPYINKRRKDTITQQYNFQTRMPYSREVRFKIFTLCNYEHTNSVQSIPFSINKTNIFTVPAMHLVLQQNNHHQFKITVSNTLACGYVCVCVRMFFFFNKTSFIH